MLKKVLILTTAAMITIGSATFVYAAGKGDNKVNKLGSTPAKLAAYQSAQTSAQENMFDIMEKNGFGDIANEMRKGNYKAMNDFMNNLSDKDYQKMIDLMRNNGYEGMANLMQNIGKEGMIQMHNAMGGAGTFCGAKQSFGGMMGRNLQSQ